VVIMWVSMEFNRSLIYFSCRWIDCLDCRVTLGGYVSVLSGELEEGQRGRRG
jgi:hypothetical protein